MFLVKKLQSYKVSKAYKIKSAFLQRKKMIVNFAMYIFSLFEKITIISICM